MLAKNFLWHTWNLKLWTTWKTFLAHTSNLNVETLNNSKNFFPHTFSNFNVETLNNLKNSLPHTLKPRTLWRTFFLTLWTQNLKLKDLKNTLPHLRTYNTLKKSFSHLLHTWKSCKLFVCHHLEMNSHSLCKLKLRLSKGFSPLSYAIQAQNLSLLFVLTQCSFSCLVWAHNPIGNNLKTSKKWKIQGSWNGTIVLTNKKIIMVICSIATITKLWLATTNNAWRLYVHSKTMKGENERLLKTTPLYIIS
jgi:hypothetical protein